MICEIVNDYHYTWYLNGRKVFESNVKTLTLDDIKLEEHDQLTCEVHQLPDQKMTPGSFTITSTKYGTEKKEEVGTEQKIRLTEGQDVTIKYNTDQKGKIKWLHNRQETYQHEQHYTIKDSLKNLEGQYECRVTGADSPMTTASMNIDFTVTDLNVWGESVDQLPYRTTGLQREIDNNRHFETLGMLFNFTAEERDQIEAAQWGGGSPHKAFIQVLQRNRFSNREILEGVREGRLEKAEQYV